MAWDIFIQDLPDVPSVADIPKDFVPKGIGTRTRIGDRIMEVVPFAEPSEDSWFFVRTPEVDLSISLSMGDGEEVSHIVVHVHGGERSAACVAAIIHRLGLRALDTATGEFFDEKDPEQGYTAWARYCDLLRGA